MTSLRDMPIELKILPWTGKIDGDDDGYRDVDLSALDQESPDPMIALSTTGILHNSVYAHAPLPYIYPFRADIGATKEIWMRLPAVEAIQSQNRILVLENRQVLVIDGFRSAPVTAKMWALIHSQILKTAPYSGRDYYSLTPVERVQLGDKTEVTGAHVAVVKDDRYNQLFDSMRTAKSWKKFVDQCHYLGMVPDKVMERLLVYEANLGFNNLNLDRAASTAHGNGGADDSWLVSSETGNPTCNGVHYDYTGPACRLDFFESPERLEAYQEEVAKNDVLKEYLKQFGITTIDRNVFEVIRAERRMWFHSAARTGASMYIEEPWHSNRDNSRGGKQFSVLPGSGNSCQALLKNVRDPQTARWTACWTNEVAHALVEQLEL